MSRLSSPISEQLGIPFTLLKEVQRVNQAQLERFLKRLRDTLWVLKDKRIAVWGLTFKPDTDDVRDSVAVELVNYLLREGAIVQTYDPKRGRESRPIESVSGVPFWRGLRLKPSRMPRHSFWRRNGMSFKMSILSRSEMHAHADHL